MKKERPTWKKYTTGILLLFIGLAGFLLGGWFTGNDRHDHDEPSAAVSEQIPAAEAVQQLYTCAMHPQVRSPNPDDKCPICGMELIPVPVDDDPAEEAGDLTRLRVTPRAAALMQVAVWPVESRQVNIPVRLYGRISYDETRLRTVAAWMPGRLDRLHVNFTGTPVRQGQPMVEIYSPTLITAQEEHLQAMQTARELEGRGIPSVSEAARMTVSASHDRLRLLGLGGDQIKALEQRGRVEERLVIPAPVSGVVIERLATTGDYVETGRPIYRLADLSHLWVALEAYETDIQWIELNQLAVFTTQSHPGERFEGRVTFIDPVLNERNRTVGVRVELPNPEGRLKPGMFVRGTIEATPGSANARPLVIPATAPLITGPRALVYVQLPDTEQPTFEPRQVLLGPRAGDWYIVYEGLNAGELVVTNGAFKIDAELQIRGRPSMMQPEGGPPPTHDHGAPAAAPPIAATTTDTEVRTEAPQPFQVQLGRLVAANFDLVSALAADDDEAAGQTAMRIDGLLHSIDPTLLTADTHRRQWNRLSRLLHDSLLGVATGAEMMDQRLAFRTFSHTLIEIANIFGVADTGSVYQAMCPMFEGGDSFWLQPVKEITNPYFGAMMQTCGEIVETIAAPDDPHGGH